MSFLAAWLLAAGTVRSVASMEYYGHTPWLDGGLAPSMEYYGHVFPRCR